MPRLFRFVIGTPPINTAAVTQVSKDFSAKYTVKKVVQKLFTVKYNIPSPTIGNVTRFFGDPGIGNIYMGLSNPGGDAAYDARATAIGFNLGVARTFNSSGVIGWTHEKYHALKGRIPWPDANSIAGVNYPNLAAMNAGGIAYAQAMINGALGCKDSAGRLVPVWISMTHEPGQTTKFGDNTGVDSAAHQSYRAGKRALYQYIKNNACTVAGPNLGKFATNIVFTDCCYQTQDFSANTRDWRRYCADWKGTTKAGSTPLIPDPSDFYSGVNSCIDINAGDFYNFWGDTGEGANVTVYDEFNTRAQQFVTSVKKAMPTIPLACAEWGHVAYCGSPTHTAEVFSAANFNKTVKWKQDAYDFMIANGFVAASYFDSSTTKSATGLTDPVDPGNANSSPYSWGIYAMRQLHALATTKRATY